MTARDDVINARNEATGMKQEMTREATHSACSPRFPVLLSDVQAAASMGISVRKFHELRHEEWMPKPVVLGPRCLRWPRAELEQAVAAMPRQQKPAVEPLQLAKGRAARAGRTEISA